MKTKKCPKCPEPKPLSEFSKDKYTKDGLQVYCKEHCNKYSSKYYNKNSDKISVKLKNKHKKHPCINLLNSIKKRCENPNVSNYEFYGGKGIKCLITLEELEYLWNRDKAYLMDKPQISRKDHSKNYILDNCKIEEKLGNVGERNKRVLSKPVLQYDLQGNFIREWESGRAASSGTAANCTSISKCCRNLQKVGCGFVWKFKYQQQY